MPDTPSFNDVVRLAENEFKEDKPFYLLAFAKHPPEDWSANQVSLARSLVRRESRYAEGIAAYWTARGFEGDLDDARLAATPPAKRAELETYSAWTKPLGQLRSPRGPHLARSLAVFALNANASHAGNGAVSIAIEAVALTSRVAVLWTMTIGGGHAPWFPQPIALVDRNNLDTGIAGALRKMGSTLFARLPDTLTSSHSAAELFRILAHSASPAGDKVWTMSEKQLAALKVKGLDWTYADLAARL